MTLSKFSYYRNGAMRLDKRRRTYVNYHDIDGNLIKRVDWTAIYNKGRERKPRIDRTITTLIYEFDDRGNWTRRLQTTAGKQARVSIREIEYYD